MKYTIAFLGLSFIGLLFPGCSGPEQVDADTVLDKAMNSHGSYNLFGKEISFDFRDWSYRMYRDTTYYKYIRKKGAIEDHLHSREGFSRLIRGKEVAVVDSMAVKYSNSLNSVLYFFQLPLVLNDPAVQKEYKGIIRIKEQEYHTLKVTFQQEGGGVDFEDEFRYWINSETGEIDYLAYSYLTDGGGVRFREAIRKHKLDGVLFQDYRNFKPQTGTRALDSLPADFERGGLELLSTIENENIRIESGE